MSAPLHILSLEDEPKDSELIQELLAADKIACRMLRVQTRDDFARALENDDFDLILSDYKLPSFDGLSALKLALSVRPDLPFIFVSGALGEEAAIDALKIGATDYVLKTQLSRLVPAVQRALREAQERAERIKAEDSLQRSEKELREVIETIPIIAFTALPDGSSVWINRRWVEYSGQSIEETTGSGWQAAVHPDDVEEHVAKWQRAMASGEAFENEARHRSADGEYRWFLVRCVPLRDQQGRILKWYGALTDIDDRRRAEQERERLRQLEANIAHAARVSMLGELTASIAHEIAQPLTGIRTNGQMALRWLDQREPDVPRTRDTVSRLLADTHRGVEIIDRIRAMATRRTPERKPLPLGDIVEESLVFLSHELRSKGISVSLNLGRGLPPVCGDRTQLQQVIVNIVANAAQALAKSASPRRNVLVRTFQPDPQTLCCVIEDSGPGIDPAHLPHVFKSFFTTKDHGMGMGLAICKSIVEVHDGRIAADNESTLGGARFSFTLPAQH
jgi:PAS domain S-box-containing protein